MSRHIRRARPAILPGALLLPLNPGRPAAQEAEVEAFVRAQPAARRIPGASVAVVKDGNVVLARGYGLANVEHVPATSTRSTSSRR